MVSIIEGEHIANLVFKNEDALVEESERIERLRKLRRAVEVNRILYLKTRLQFVTAEGIKEVHAHVWEVTDNHVILNGGISLPVPSIVKVDVCSSLAWKPSSQPHG